MEPDASAPRPGHRRAARWLAKLLLALVIFGCTAEVVVRWLRPQPRYQIVRHTRGIVLEQIDGVPVWHFGEHLRRWRLDCMAQHPDARPVIAIGSSIFYGSNVPVDQVFTVHLQQHLDQHFGAGETCVMNFAQPGYAAQNELAEARRWLPRYPGALILWQVWDQDPGEYVVLGDHAYSLPYVALDEDGYPDAFPLPRSLDHWLFHHSVAYEYAALALAPSHSPMAGHVIFAQKVVPKLEEARLLAAQHRSRLVLFMMPYLDQSFRRSTDLEARRGARLDGYRPVADWSDRHEVRRIEVAELLIDEDVETLRLDPCCHYNAKGHQVLAARMLDDVVAGLALMAPSSPSPMVPADP